MVLCAGQIKKWRCGIVGYDIGKLRVELEASRDYVFAATGIERKLFKA
jgi:5-methylthioadenosine/S-adenosylhomocysteine deaminase